MGRIVVGVDGSLRGQEALRFALSEARLREAVLEAIYVWRLPVSESMPDAFLLEAPLEPSLAPGELEKALERRAQARLEAAIHEVLGDEEPGVELRSEALEGRPVLVLLERASGADLLVLGARGHGGFAGLLLGSVSSQCIQHALCPVVIVPGDRDITERR